MGTTQGCQYLSLKLSFNFTIQVTILFILFQGREFTEEFLLEYQREDGGEWMRFRNKYGEEVKLLNAGIVTLQYSTHNIM